MGRASRKKRERTSETPTDEEILFVKPATPNFLSRTAIVVLIISALATIIYSNTFSNPFIFDDTANIMNNPDIRHLWGTLDFWGARYIGFLSFALNYQFSDLNVFGYHLVNLIIHIVNGLLVYAFVLLTLKASGYDRYLTDDPSIDAASEKPHVMPRENLIALIAALLFVTHPIQTQAITYIVQRFTSLVTLFYLLSIVCYLKWRLDSLSQQKVRWAWYAAAIFSGVLAMKTKQISFTLPFMILLIEVIFFKESMRKRWLALMPFLLLLFIIPLSHVDFVKSAELGIQGQTSDASHLNHIFKGADSGSIESLSYLFTQFRVIVTYIRLLFFPVSQNLDYEYPVYSSLMVPSVFISFLFLASLFTMALFFLWRTKDISYRTQYTQSTSGLILIKLIGFGIIWFFLTLSVTSSIYPIKDVIFEHRVYLPSIGIFLVASLLLIRAWTSFKKARYLIVIFVLSVVCVLSILTYRRNLIWQDPVTLWKDVVLKSPNKVRGHGELGDAYLGRGQLEDAVNQLKTAISLNPDYAIGYSDLGVVYRKMGRHEEALNELNTAIKLIPHYSIAHNNIGAIYEDQGLIDKATEKYKEAVKLQPDNIDAYNNLGGAYKKQGRLAEAIETYKTALRLNPNSQDLKYKLAIAYKDHNSPDEAIQEFQSLIQLHPNNAEAHNDLGLVYVHQGRLAEAVKEFQAALKLEPDNIGAHNNLGTVYGVQGMLDKAIEQFKASLQLQPDRVETRYNLGRTYQSKGLIEDARSEFMEILRINPDFSPASKALDKLGGTGRK